MIAIDCLHQLRCQFFIEGLAEPDPFRKRHEHLNGIHDIRLFVELLDGRGELRKFVGE